MSWILIIFGGLLSGTALVVVIQALRKAAYGKVVYQELDYSPEGRLLKKRIQTHPDEELRMQLALMQIEVLKVSYAEKLPPSASAQRIIDAINEIPGAEQMENAKLSQVVDAPGAGQSVKRSAAAPAFMEIARLCALTILENANYITKELGNVQMKDVHRTQTREICQALGGTSYGVLLDLPEFIGSLDSGAENSTALDYTEHVLHQLQKELARLHQLVIELEAESRENLENQIASILVSESSANILNAFNPALAALESMRSRV